MKKINKVQARKLYKQEIPFIIVPCNLRPECGIIVGEAGHPYYECEDTFENFDALYNTFCYYNCDNERGRYPAFYLPE